MSFARRYREEERRTWWLPDAVGVFQTRRQRIALVLIGLFMFIAAIASLVIYFIPIGNNETPSPSPPSPGPSPGPGPGPGPEPSPAPAVSGNYNRGYFLPTLFGGSVLIGLIGVAFTSIWKINLTRWLVPLGITLFITTVILFVVRSAEDTDLTQTSFMSTGVDIFIILTAFTAGLFIGNSLIPAIESSSAVTNNEVRVALGRFLEVASRKAKNAKEMIKKKTRRSQDGDSERDDEDAVDDLQENDDGVEDERI